MIKEEEAIEKKKKDKYVNINITKNIFVFS